MKILIFLILVAVVFLLLSTFFFVFPLQSVLLRQQKKNLEDIRLLTQKVNTLQKHAIMSEERCGKRHVKTSENVKTPNE